MAITKAGQQMFDASVIVHELAEADPIVFDGDLGTPTMRHCMFCDEMGTEMDYGTRYVERTPTPQEHGSLCLWLRAKDWSEKPDSSPVPKPEPPGRDGISNSDRENGGWWVYRDRTEKAIARHSCSPPSVRVDHSLFWKAVGTVGSVWQCLVPTDPTRTWKQCGKRYIVRGPDRTHPDPHWQRYRGRIGRPETH